MNELVMDNKMKP